MNKGFTLAKVFSPHQNKQLSFGFTLADVFTPHPNFSLSQSSSGNSILSRKGRGDKSSVRSTVTNLVTYCPSALVSCKSSTPHPSPLPAGERGHLAAFTLSEVLITLGIIGVVAAITMPTLIAKHKEKVTVTKVKQTYSIIGQALKRWEFENGCIGSSQDCYETRLSAYDSDMMIDMMQYIKTIDTVKRGEDKSNKTWLADKPATSLNGTTTSSSCNWIGVNKTDTFRTMFLLPNGVSLAIVFESYKQNIDMMIDINNSQPPNRVGVDVFPISIDAYNNKNYIGLNPFYGEDSVPGCDGGLCSTRNGNICNADDGKSPTAYVLTHDKLPNLKQIFGK